MRSITRLSTTVLDAGRTPKPQRCQAHFGSLSPREPDMLIWVVSGLLNKQVVAEIGTTEATVKFHRGRLMRKMGADSLADLVKWPINYGSVSHLAVPVLRAERCAQPQQPAASKCLVLAVKQNPAWLLLPFFPISAEDP